MVVSWQLAGEYVVGVAPQNECPGYLTLNFDPDSVYQVVVLRNSGLAGDCVNVLSRS